MEQALPSRRTPGLLSALALLFAGAFLRCPPILLHGRVWAEESTVFLLGAWSRPFGTELVKPEFGYYSLWDDLFAALSAHVVPLPWVALLFTWSAVLLLLVTGYFLYQAEFLPTRTAKTLSVLSLLLVAPSTETWLNLINSEFYFGIIAAVILFSDAAHLRLPRALMLALAAISGPLTALIAPLFFLRAVLKRRPPEILQAVVVCGGALLQVAVALTTNTANRKVHLAPLTLGPVLFNKQIVLLFFDRVTAKLVYLTLRDRLHYSFATLLGTWFLALLAFVALAWLLRRNRSALFLLGTGLYFALAESALALNGGLQHVAPEAGERYAFTPNFLLELALLTAVFASLPTAAHPRRPILLRVLLSLALFSGFVDYLILPLQDHDLYQAEPWRQQALHWQQNPAIDLHALPTVWRPFHLPPQRQTK